MLHLDTASAGRTSPAVRRAAAEHAEREAEIGAYPAAAEAGGRLAAGREALAVLLGVPADGVAFTTSATAGLHALLDVWRLPPAPVVAVAPSEWGPNLREFAMHGATVRLLPVDGAGRVDIAALESLLRTAPPALVHLTQLAAHRPLVQPVADAVAVCRAAGVPIWVDAAQALGHLDAATGADAVYATSRKWLRGPRGVGVLGVRHDAWPCLDVAPLVLQPDAPPVGRLEPTEAAVAARLGLCVAAAEHVAAGPGEVRERLVEVGDLTRSTLAGVPGWQVVPCLPGSGAITALRPTAGQSVSQVQQRLLAEHDVLVAACLPVRAPHEMTEPLLRLSPHVDLNSDDLEVVAAALCAVSC
jgi:pyridoxal 5-phosphate dependent beta-lyase